MVGSKIKHEGALYKGISFASSGSLETGTMHFYASRSNRAIHKTSDRLVSELMNAIKRIDLFIYFFMGQKKNTWHFFSLVCFSFGHPLEYVT